MSNRLWKWVGALSAIATVALLCVVPVGANPAQSSANVIIPTIAADSGNAGATGHYMLGAPADTILAGGTLYTNWMPCSMARYIVVSFRDSAATGVYGDSLDEAGIQFTMDPSSSASSVSGAKQSMSIVTAAGTALTCDTTRTQMFSINACMAGVLSGTSLTNAAAVDGGLINIFIEPQMSAGTSRTTIGMRAFRLRFHVPVVRNRITGASASVTTAAAPSVIGLKCFVATIYDGPPPAGYNIWAK